VDDLYRSDIDGTRISLFRRRNARILKWGPQYVRVSGFEEQPEEQKRGLVYIEKR
jgi:hypothetical protein